MSDSLPKPILIVRKLDGGEWTRPVFAQLEVSAPGRLIMGAKAGMMGVEIREISMPLAQILKQEALSVGADFATPKDAILLKAETTSGLLIATKAQWDKLLDKMDRQPLGGKTLSARLRHLAETPKAVPKLMGILNLTPDSFFDGGKFHEKDTALAQLNTLKEEGAELVDLGPFSSRSGAEKVSEEEQIRRLALCLEEAVQLFGGARVSVDCRELSVAKYALENGAGIVNDISAGGDPNLFSLVKNHDAGIVLMHMQGEPDTMQRNPQYQDVVTEVLEFLYHKTQSALSHHIPEEKIIVDPGIGFGKTLDHNLALIRNTSALNGLGFPVLLGLSRKSFLKGLGSGELAEDRLAGSLAAAIYAVQQGAAILRVHDVADTKKALNTFLSLSEM